MADADTNASDDTCFTIRFFVADGLQVDSKFELLVKASDTVHDVKARVERQIRQSIVGELGIVGSVDGILAVKALEDDSQTLTQASVMRGGILMATVRDPSDSELQGYEYVHGLTPTEAFRSESEEKRGTGH